MKRLTSVLVLAALLVPLALFAARRSEGAGKIHPMMLGPKLSTNLIPTGELLKPITISGDMLLNLYRNQLWLRTDILALSIYQNSNSFGINLGSPFDILLMGRYRDLRPYAFGGLGLWVDVVGEELSSWIGIDLGGGVSYEISRGLHLFGELGGRLGYTTPSENGALDYAVFLGAGVRFAFVW